MKKIISLLLFGFYLGLASPASAQFKPKKAKRAFAHTAVNGAGKKNDRSRFRHGNKDKNPLIDFGRGKSEKFRTARANPNYKFPNPHK